MEIAGRLFVVAGGASGLGRATAERLVAAGGRVAVLDRDAEAGEAVARRLGDAAGFWPVDVTDPAGVEAALRAATERFGALRGAVNCAGVAIAERVLGRRGPHDLAAFARVVTVNLVGTFNVLRLAAQLMAEADPLADGERGVIVNTASVAAFEGQIGQAAYSASKGGVVSLTLPAARELAALGIRVMAIAPGIFDTPMLAALPEPARRSLGEQVPFPRRLGQPAEYAQLVQHIIENPMLNGSVIRLDGAIRMAPR
ncbi:MAG: 3-hydroxyacyl-CoA dehydrogenase [Actinomycetia bacterium]|nr:3-hydroxyacyl-CoA dehydrogenase [Actinomycetes bacterium]